MKILITGGVGFVGGHLARSLSSDGMEVHLLDNMVRGVEDEFIKACITQGNVKLLHADLNNVAAMSALDDDYDVIYHLAAIIGVKHVLNEPYKVLTDNVRMTENVISHARRQRNLKRLLFSSTSEVYAGTLIHMDMPIPTPESTPIALTSLVEPRTSYMLSKLYGECMCNLSQLPITNVRLHNIYGPRMGMSHVIPELLFKAWALENGTSLGVSSMDHMRTFCYVDDAVNMMRRLVEAEDSIGKTVNIGNQTPEITIGELAQVIVSTVGKKLEIISATPTPGSPSRRCPSTKLLHQLTKVDGLVDLKEGVKRTYAWYLDNVFKNGGVTAR